MPCIGGLRYKIGLQCKYAKLLTTEMSQCVADLCKNRPAEAQFRSVLIFYDFVWRDFVR